MANLATVWGTTDHGIEKWIHKTMLTHLHLKFHLFSGKGSNVSHYIVKHLQNGSCLSKDGGMKVNTAP